MRINRDQYELLPPILMVLCLLPIRIDIKKAGLRENWFDILGAWRLAVMSEMHYIQMSNGFRIDSGDSPMGATLYAGELFDYS
jgi:hypothetical protein